MNQDNKCCFFVETHKIALMTLAKLYYILLFTTFSYLVNAQGTMHNEWPHFGSVFFDVDAIGSEVTAAGDNVIIHSSDAGTTWGEINFPFKSARLKHISRVSEGHYVAAGASIYVTTNNGQDWVENVDMHSVITMENFGNTIIVTRDIEGEQFMRSDDGGDSWGNLSTANDSLPTALDFIDQDNAYYSAVDGTIYYSSDGGQNWDMINDSSFDQGMESLGFMDVNTGYAQLDDLVWETTDGGVSWEEITNTFTASGGLFPLPSGLYLYSSSSFSLFENGSSSYIMQDYDVDVTFSYDVAEADGKLFLSGSGMVLVHNIGASLEEWEDLTPGPNNGFNLMASRGDKFVVTGGRRMQISNSQGVDFVEADTEFSNLSDLEIAPDGTIYETQTGLKRSINDGADWEFIASSTTLVHIFDDGRIITAGGGKIKQSNDNASTFEDLYEYTGFPVHLYFYDDNFGWLMTLSGTSYRTMDGGMSWEAIEFPVGASPSRMHFINDEIGFAVKKLTDRFWKTIDGGTTWEEQVFGNEADLTDVYFEDEMIGYVCGRFDGSVEGVVYKTINGGNSWEVFQRGRDLFWEIEYDESSQKLWVCGDKAQLYSYSECADLKPTLEIDMDHISCNESSEWYKWYLNGEFLVETTEPFINYVSQAVYTVRIKGEGDCVSELSDEISTIVDVKELLDATLVSIYPNPSCGDVKIELADEVAIESIEVFNLQGQSVFQSKSGENEYKLTALSQGNYFVKIYTSEGVAVKQLNLSR